MKRTVIIHNHIFKNAGTTFDSILKKNFGEAFCDHRDDDEMREKGRKYLLDYLQKKPAIKALSSHAIAFSLESFDGISIIPVYFIRHPIERIASVYNFEKKQPPVSLGAKMAKKLSFEDYIKWRMQDNAPAIIRNVHTRRLAGVKKNREMMAEDFEKALSSLKKNLFIGLVHRFEESMKYFEYEFKKNGISMNFSYKPENVSFDSTIYSQEEKAEQVLLELGDLRETVIQKNTYDLKLFSEANKKLDEALKKIK